MSAKPYRNLRTEPWPWWPIWRGFQLAINHRGAGGRGGYDGRHLSAWSLTVWMKYRRMEKGQ